MRYILARFGLTLAICSVAFAQERIVVPARNSAQPRRLDINLMQGNVFVRTHTAPDVVIEAGHINEDRERTVNGMRRVDIPSRGLTVEEENNTITVRNRMAGGGDVTIFVPADTSLTGKSFNGNIEVEGLRGEFAVQTNNGHVTLTDVSGSVLASSLNGPIRVSMVRVDPSKPLSFSTLNGPIDVTLPADWKANVKLNTHHGEIWTDFDFRLGPGTITQQNTSRDGRYVMRMDRNITATVNGGGAEATFQTLNGRINIKKR